MIDISARAMKSRMPTYAPSSTSLAPSEAQTAFHLMNAVFLQPVFSGHAAVVILVMAHSPDIKRVTNFTRR